MSPLSAFYLGWAIAAVVVYSIVLALAFAEWGRHHDKRSRRELYIAAALHIASVSSLFGIALAILETGNLFRFGFSALALGSFLGAGIVIALEYIKREREA